MMKNTHGLSGLSAHVAQRAVAKNTRRPPLGQQVLPRGGQLSKREIVRRDVAQAMADYLKEASNMMLLCPISDKTTADDVDMIALEAERRFRNQARLILVVNSFSESGLERSCTKFRAAALRKATEVLDYRRSIARAADRNERTIHLEFSLDMDP